MTDTHASYVTGTTSTVLLSDLSPDKPGVVLYRLFQEGTSVDRAVQPIPLMTIDFTDTLDSDGNAWATTDALAGLTAELGETYLTTIEKLVSTGAIDVEMGPDLIMHAYNAQGRDLSGTTFGAGKVRFVKGANIADELRRERHDNPVATFIEVVGTDGVTATAALPDAATRVARETSGTGDSGDTTVLAALGLAALNARLVSSDAIGFRIATGDDDATGLYLPGPDWTEHGDFWLGDITTLHTGTGEMDFNQADERVYAITIADDDAGNIEVTPEIGSVLGAAEMALYGGTSTTVTSFTTRSPTTDTSVAEGGLSQDALDAHTGDATDAHDASAISFTPTGTIAATDVQAAIAEVASEAGALPSITVEDHGAVGNGVTDDTAAIQAAIDAAESAGGGVVYFPPGVYIVDGALQDTSRSNSQLLLPRRDAVDTEQITVELRGAFAPPPIVSVVGTTPVPDGHSVIKGTLNTASGTAPALLGAWGPVGTFENFTMLHLRITDLTFRMPSNPALSALDLAHVTGVELDNVIVDVGSYYVQGLTEPTTTASVAIKLPINNNGAFSRLGAVNVIGFYTGYEFSEHSEGEQVAAWGCKIAAKFLTATNHASHLDRFMFVHCERGLQFTGAHWFSIDQLNIEHAASGWWVTDYDIDDASNYGHGHLAWHVVLAGTGPDNTFTVNGATDIYRLQIGDDPFAGGSPSGAACGDLSGTYPNPSVVDDSHSHTSATVPSGSGIGPLLIEDIPAGTPLVFADLLQNEEGTDLLYADTA